MCPQFAQEEIAILKYNLSYQTITRPGWLMSIPSKGQRSRASRAADQASFH
jgi:hypothetical protein